MSMPQHKAALNVTCRSDFGDSGASLAIEISGEKNKMEKLLEKNI